MQGSDGKRRLPITWKGGGMSIRDSAEVVAPTAEETQFYTNGGFAQEATTCATCKKFDLAAGQRQMQSEQFTAKLVAEYQWKVRHLGAGPETFGLCKETNDRITSLFSAACPHYRSRNGSIRGLFSGM